MKIHFIFTSDELRYFQRTISRDMSEASLQLLTNIFRQLWLLLLYAVNAVDWLAKKLKKAIMEHACWAVVLTFVSMLTITFIVHMRMKVKLTTAEWQRDSLELRLDSIKTYNGTKTSYFKYQEYKNE